MKTLSSLYFLASRIGLIVVSIMGTIRLVVVTREKLASSSTFVRETVTTLLISVLLGSILLAFMVAMNRV